LIEHQEGKANFRANLSGKDKGPGKIKGVFYNPSMKFSRDLNVEFAKKLDFGGLFLDGMAASGIRGIRLALECNFNVEFCDTSKLAIDAIKDNLILNNLKSQVFHADVQDIVKQRKYDWIDIDPFGTPAPYLDAVIENIKDGGILGVAATDTAVLCGAKPSICFKRYGSYSMKRVAAKEVGIRILLGRIQTLARKHDKSIEPLLSYSEGHHLRVFLKIIEKKDISLKWLNYEMEVLNTESTDSAGPLWMEKIIQLNLVPENCDGRLGKFFDILRKEADGPPGLFDINDMARDAEIGQTPKKLKIIECIMNEGFFASSSVFSPLGIKTNAPHDVRIKATKFAQSL
jgi:tRNA (guanine26-N2/guanine27-N2)-dimethyltransferase